MKKYISQILVACVCALLGFLLAYQFKLLSDKEKAITPNNYNQVDITAEIEQLKKEKSEVEKKNNELLNQLKKYEDAAADNNDLTKELKKQLDDTRLIMGSLDVEGPGVTIYLNPKNSVFSSNASNQYITDNELVFIVNELNFAGAEAISINDKRVSIQTGIKSSSNNNFIEINSEKISPRERIVIKAIGNKSDLYAMLNFPGALDFQALPYYDKKFEQSDSVKISKFNRTYKYDYLKPVK